MSAQSGSGISVEKTLHEKDAFVLSMGYVSLTKPILKETIQTYFWALPETETVIADREERHPQFVRFSNWQRIEDRETGNPVIYLTEDRIDRLFDDVFPGGTIIPDSYRYEINVPE